MLANWAVTRTGHAGSFRSLRECSQLETIVLARCGEIPFPLALAAWWLHTSNRPLFRKLYPFLLFAAHGVLVCFLIAVGRSGGDPQSALTSHYSLRTHVVLGRRSRPDCGRVFSCVVRD